MQAEIAAAVFRPQTPWTCEAAALLTVDMDLDALRESEVAGQTPCKFNADARPDMRQDRILHERSIYGKPEFLIRNAVLLL